MADRENGDVQFPEQLTLQVGQSESIRLPGLGTAGYQWNSRADSDIVDVRWERGQQPGAAPLAAGVSAPETVTFTGRHVGATTVELVQARPWEPADAALARRSIAVTVVE